MKKLAALIALTIGCSSTAYAQQAQQSEPSELLQLLNSSLFVASPEEIIQIRKQAQEIAAAKNAPILEPNYGLGVNDEILDIEESFDLTTEPGEDAPRIFISRNLSTAVNFVDIHGNHWPIRKISSWMDGLIDISRALDGLQATDENGNVMSVDPSDPLSGSFTVTALKHAVVGNITVYLQGLSRPITIVVQAKPQIFHRNANIRIGRAGPNTNYQQAFTQKVRTGSKFSYDLNNALHGVTPADSEPLHVEGGAGKAWAKGDHVFLMTDLAIFSPSPIETTHASGRFKAVMLPKTTRAMGTNAAGQTVQLQFKRIIGVQK